MTIIRDSWEDRFKITEEIKTKKYLPFSDKIHIEQYKAEDILLKQNVILKLIKINEDLSIANLAQYLWHYEILLNQRATNNSRGKSLLKLIYARRDQEKGIYVLVTESGGVSLRELLFNKEATEERQSFRNFKSSANKKIVWESILHLIEGLYSLHSSGLIHRNISLDSIYFDGEAYRQGEKEILRIGDFNWSIYLYSLSNLFSDELTSEIIKDNYHFFRAPECLPINIDKSIECSGETYQSDLFSLGLILVFLLIDFDDVEQYINSDIKERNILYQNILERVQELKGYPQEKEILSKLVDTDIDKRYQNVGELIADVQNLLSIISVNFISEPKVPLFFKLERTAPLLRQIANNIDYNIDAILRNPNDFLKYEFKDCRLYLTNDIEFPLWTKGKSTIYYKFGRVYRNHNLALIHYFIPGREKGLKLTNIEICIVKEFCWFNHNDQLPYSNWEEIFANALRQIKEREIEESPEMQKRLKWLEAVNLIEEAEEELEEKRILEYEVIDDSYKENNREDIRNIIIQVINDEDKDLLTDIIEEANTNYVELLDSDYLFEDFKHKRSWRIKEILDITRDFTTVQLEGSKRNSDPQDKGYIRLWDLRSTIFLLMRKRHLIQNLENNEHLLNAILQPASSHMFFEKYNQDDIINFIYYTNPIFLLQGPPGTGKTWTAKELIKLTLERDPFSRILVASKEHSALDDLLIKCVDMLNKSGIKTNPHLIRLISPDRELLYSTDSIPYNRFITQEAKSILQNIYKWMISNQEKFTFIKDEKNRIQLEFISPSKEWIDLIRESSNIVFCTSTAHDLKELEASTKNFDLVIIEEAGKAYPSELFKPMQLGNKWVLIGDQNQLPPFRIEDIYQIIEKKLEKKEELEKNEDDYDPRASLKFKKAVKKEIKIFDSMFNKFKKIKHSFNKEDKTRACDTLLGQYRLPSNISKMISSIFYAENFNQKIEDTVNFFLEPFNFRNQQLIWINTTSERDYREKRDGINIFNMSEVQLIRSILFKLKIGDQYHPISLAILSPYKKQVEYLNRYLPSRLPNLKEVNIRERCFTVDSFQGQEADLVIISLVRNNNYENSRSAWGFVPQQERLNVMLSRAKKAEIIVGNFDMCYLYRGDPYMEKLNKVADFFKENALVLKHNEVVP